MRNSHCSYCGARFPDGAPWPRTCASCRNTSYLNPIPVAVVLLPVDAGLLTIRRTIEPERGRLALPGGYVNSGETWQQGAARELFEETGIRIASDEVRHFSTLSSPRDLVIIFGTANARRLAELPPFKATDETGERVIIDRPVELAFDLHTRAVREYFEAKSR